MTQPLSLQEARGQITRLKKAGDRLAKIVQIGANLVGDVSLSAPCQPVIDWNKAKKRKIPPVRHLVPKVWREE